MARNDDLTELISEMVIKQDRTNEILEDFMAVSIKQFEQQVKFNERFLDKLENLKLYLISLAF
jgi:hypothetical protein